MKQLSFAILFIFALSACKSVDKLYEAGEYQQIISKLDGKAKRNSLDRKERNMMVKAANKYFETEQAKVLTSLRSGDFKDWKDAKQKIKRLQKESDKFAEYPQLREGEIDASRLSDLATEVDQKLFDYTYDLYDEGIAEYQRTGDRIYVVRAASDAYALKKYGASQRLTDSLYYAAAQLGHRFIAVDFDRDVFNSWEFRNNFQNEVDFRDDDFNTFTSMVGPETDYRIIVAAEISDTDVYKDDSYQEFTEEIEDGYETEIDTATNKEIKIPIYKKITATVKAVEYTWVVEGRGQYEIYDVKANTRFDSGRFSAEAQDQAVFYYLEDGDEDAVPSSIDLETFGLLDPDYDIDDLVEECFSELADAFNSSIDVNRKLK